MCENRHKKEHGGNETKDPVYPRTPIRNMLRKIPCRQTPHHQQKNNELREIQVNLDAGNFEKREAPAILRGRVLFGHSVPPCNNVGLTRPLDQRPCLRKARHMPYRAERIQRKNEGLAEALSQC